MPERISNIAQNTSYFTLASILQKVISFTYFALIARALGPEDLGKYYFAISFSTIFAVFIELGLANVLTREVARNKTAPGNLLGNVLIIKIPLTLLTLISLIMSVNILGYNSLVRYLIYISAISMVLDSFTATFFAVSRGFHNLGFESIGSVIFQLIVLFTGLSIIKLEMGLVWLMTSLSTASIFNMLYSGWLVFIRFKVPLIFKYDSVLARYIITVTIPFALSAIAQRFYTYFDTILLAHFADDTQVGIYQIGFKIIFALQFLPLAFIASLYPAMSQYWSSNRSQLGITFERAMNYLIIVSLPIAIGISSIADKIILIFNGDNNEAILPLQINISALVIVFITYPIGALLNACDQQKTNTINIIITLFTSIFLNLLLIPRFQAVGASITVAVTNAMMFCLGAIYVPKIIGYKPWAILVVLAKALIAALIMAIITIYLKTNSNIVFTIAFSGIMYFLLLYLFKAFRKEDIISICSAFHKKICHLTNL